MRSMSSSTAATNTGLPNASTRRCASTATIPDDNDYAPSAPVVVSAVNGSGAVLPNPCNQATPAGNLDDAILPAENDQQSTEVNRVLSESNKENIDLSTMSHRKTTDSQPPSQQMESVGLVAWTGE